MIYILFLQAVQRTRNYYNNFPEGAMHFWFRNIKPYTYRNKLWEEFMKLTNARMYTGNI